MILHSITNLLLELDGEALVDQVQHALDEDLSSQDILRALTQGMEEVGKRYESGEYFLSELVLAGETMKDALEVLKPHLTAAEGSQKGPVLLATVKGDNHDIGKNILGSLLVSAGIEVIDLGVNCSAEQIVEAVKIHNVKVLGLSSLLTTTIAEIARVNETLRSEGIRDSVKLIVGGAPLSMEIAKEYGADNYGKDALEGVRIIRAYLE